MAVLVSVIMPTYNCERYISEAIESVIKQTVNDWEIQIVDDCSSDNTFKSINKYLKAYPIKIFYYRFSQNRGPAEARTEAIKRAKGKYCAFLDSDDLWTPDKIEKQIGYMEKTGLNFTCAAYQKMTANGDKILQKAIVPPPRINYKKCILLSDPIGNLTAVYNQERLGKFIVPSIKKRNDFALWLQILKKEEYCYGLNEVLGIYRFGRADSVSFNKFGNMKYHWQLYHEIERHGIIRSAFEVFCWAFVKGTSVGINTRDMACSQK